MDSQKIYNGFFVVLLSALFFCLGWFTKNISITYKYAVAKEGRLNHIYVQSARSKWKLKKAYVQWIRISIYFEDDWLYILATDDYKRATKRYKIEYRRQIK